MKDEIEDQNQVKEEGCGVVDAAAGATLRIVRWDVIRAESCAMDGTVRFAVSTDGGGVGTLALLSAPDPDDAFWLTTETGGKRYGACAIVLPLPLLERVREQARRLCAEQHRSGTNWSQYRRILMQLVIELENAAGSYISRQKPWNRRVGEARNLAESALLAVIATGRGTEGRSVAELLACDAEAGDAIAKLRAALAALERKPKWCECRINVGRYHRSGQPDDEFVDIDAFLAYLLKQHEEECRSFTASAAALEAWEAASAKTGASKQAPQNRSVSTDNA